MLILSLFGSHITLRKKKIKATVIVFSGGVLELERAWILLAVSGMI